MSHKVKKDFKVVVPTIDGKHQLIICKKGQVVEHFGEIVKLNGLDGHVEEVAVDTLLDVQNVKDLLEKGYIEEAKKVTPKVDAEAKDIPAEKRETK